MTEESRLITKEELEEYKRMKEEGYGDFTHKQENLGSARTEEVVLSAVDKCEQLQKQLDDANKLLTDIFEKALFDCTMIREYKKRWGME